MPELTPTILYLVDPASLAEGDDNGGPPDGRGHYLDADDAPLLDAPRVRGWRFPYHHAPTRFVQESEGYAGWTSRGYAVAADIGTARRVIAGCIEATLTDEDIDTWHVGALTEHAAELVALYGPFSIWGTRDNPGGEGLVTSDAGVGKHFTVTPPPELGVGLA